MVLGWIRMPKGRWGSPLGSSSGFGRPFVASNRPIFAGLHSDGYLVVVPGMYHADITDLPNIFGPSI